MLKLLSEAKVLKLLSIFGHIWAFLSIFEYCWALLSIAWMLCWNTWLRCLVEIAGRLRTRVSWVLFNARHTFEVKCVNVFTQLMIAKLAFMALILLTIQWTKLVLFLAQWVSAIVSNAKMLDALELERHVRKQIGHTFPWQISLNSSSLNFSPDDV